MLLVGGMNCWRGVGQIMMWGKELSKEREKKKCRVVGENGWRRKGGGGGELT